MMPNTWKLRCLAACHDVRGIMTVIVQVVPFGLHLTLGDSPFLGDWALTQIDEPNACNNEPDKPSAEIQQRDGIYPSPSLPPTQSNISDAPFPAPEQQQEQHQLQTVTEQPVSQRWGIPTESTVNAGLLQDKLAVMNSNPVHQVALHSDQTASANPAEGSISLVPGSGTASEQVPDTASEQLPDTVVVDTVTCMPTIEQEVLSQSSHQPESALTAPAQPQPPTAADPERNCIMPESGCAVEPVVTATAILQPSNIDQHCPVSTLSEVADMWGDAAPPVLTRPDLDDASAATVPAIDVSTDVDALMCVHSTSSEAVYGIPKTGKQSPKPAQAVNSSM